MSKISQIFSSPVIRGSYADEAPAVAFKTQGSKNEIKRLNALVNRIAKSSPFGKSVLEKAAQNYTLCFEMQTNTAGYTAPDSQKIALSPIYSDKMLVSVLVHEARHAGQFENGLNCDFGQMTVRSELMQYRAMEADAEASAAVACLEMSKNGDTKPFEKFEENACYIARELSPFAQKDAPCGDMLRAAFPAWYKDTMVKDAYEDSYIASVMNDAMLNNTEDKLPYSKSVSSADIVEKICTSPDGCYFADDKNFLEKPELLDICHRTVRTADKFFEVRKMRTGMEPDSSYQDLPTRASAMETYNAINYLGKVTPKKENAALPAAVRNRRFQGR